MRTLRPFQTLIVLALALMWIAAASIAQAMPRPSTTAGDPPMPAPKAEPPVRETLPNGMKVVIVRNTLAPVVTVETNFSWAATRPPPAFPAWPTRRSTWRSADARDDRRSDGSHLRAARRRKQRRHAAEHHPVFRHRARGRRRRCAPGSGRLHARHRRLPGGVGPGARRHRAGGRARPLQSRPTNSSTG